MDELKFYVYAYLRSKDSTTGKAGTPYYIGKGCGKRAFIEHRNAQSTHTPKNKDNIVFLETNLTNVGSLALERRYIRWYGRKDNGGILNNLTDGGDGILGVSNQTRNKMRMAKLGRKQSEELKIKRGIYKLGIDNPNYGSKRSEETKQLQSSRKTGRPQSKTHIDARAKSNKGKKRSIEQNKIASDNKIGNKNPMYGKIYSDEERQHMSNILTGMKHPVVECPHCGKFGGVSAMHRYHFDNCKMIKPF